MAKTSSAPKPNPHALGAEAPQDTDGRMSVAAQRAKTLGWSMQAIARASQDGTVEPIDSDALYDFGQQLLELSAEIEAIRNLEVAHSYGVASIEEVTDEVRARRH